MGSNVSQSFEKGRYLWTPHFMSWRNTRGPLAAGNGSPMKEPLTKGIQAQILLGHVRSTEISSTPQAWYPFFKKGIVLPIWGFVGIGIFYTKCFTQCLIFRKHLKTSIYYCCYSFQKIFFF